MLSREKPKLQVSKQSMGNLCSPIRSKSFNRYGNENYHVCLCSMQGYRTTQEDAHLVHLSFKNHSDYSLFAIFDGHNGRKASQYLSNHLITKLEQLPTLSDNESIIQIILSMDEEFCASADGHNGSTIIFCLVKAIYSLSQSSDLSMSEQKEFDQHTHKKTIKEYEIRSFWCGDSRALLIESSKTKSNTSNKNTKYKDDDQQIIFHKLSEDHRPDRPSEKLRIEAAKGMIINNRVDSKLAVSRAFGDCNLKNDKNLTFSMQRVTSLMECKTMTAQPNDQLFIFCDGLVETINNERLVRNLYHQMSKYQDRVYALGYLFDEILDGGSRDNMSAILITFSDGSNYGTNGKNKTFLPGPLYLARNNERFVKAYMRNAAEFGHTDSPQLRRAAYREDLKFLKKYGMASMSEQQLEYGKTEKNIIREIEGVIKMIDDMESKQNENEQNDKDQVVPLTQGDYEGSTEIIESSDDKRCDTPALSDVDMDEEEEEEVEGNEDSDLIKMKRSLTIVPNGGVRRSNSMQDIVRRKSSSPNVNNDGKKNNNKKLKRALSNIGSAQYNASKRRKGNMGDPIKIV